MIDHIFLSGPIPNNSIFATHDYGIVFLSFVVIAIGSYIALTLANQLRNIHTARLCNMYWLGASFALGASIWSMHFIGILALKTPVISGFSIGWVIISLIVDVCACAFGFYFVKAKNLNYINMTFAGIICGLLIGMMHYVSMEASNKNFEILYIPSLFLLSFLGSIIAAIGMLWAIVKTSGKQTVRKHIFRVITALTLGISIFTLHYVGIAATVFVAEPVHSSGIDPWIITASILIVIVFCLSLLGLYKTMEMGYRTIQQTIENLGEGLIILSEDGKVDFINPKALHMFGYESEEFTGLTFSNLLSPADREKHQAAIKRYLETGETTNLNRGPVIFEGLCKTGRIFPLEVSITDMWIGSQRKFIVLASDITLRRKVEAAFALHTSMLHYAEDPIIGKDLNGVVTTWNNGAQKLYGYTAKEMIGQSILRLFPENKKQEFQLILQKIRQGEPFKVDDTLRVTKFEKLIPVSVTVAPVRNLKGEVTGALSTIKDITHQKLLMQALSKKNLELQTANRTKDIFLTTMSHELRTPLNAILGFTGTLLMKLPGPINTEQEKQLMTIKRSAKHLLSLISDILDLAKIEAGKIDIHLEKIDIPEIIEEVAATLTPLAETKDLSLKVSVAPGEHIYALGDRRALTQIIINLANNAIKFTEKGLVEIGIEFTNFDNKKYISVNVTDTGIGIREEDAPKIFLPFEQIKEEGKVTKGTGLGLHLSQKLAFLMGTKIQFESEYGKGSRFTIILPTEETTDNKERVTTNNEDTDSDNRR